ncbi:MAG TPA: site-2 protease family protein [Vicinamibacteria bacterium]|nr:site-2 protease family protein [Vicinamibacteria bacterium]
MSEPLRGFDPRPHPPSDDPWLVPLATRRAILSPGPFERYGRHVLLFLLTAASVYVMGGPHLVLGLLAILLAHEMGHYVACRLYGVDATLPYFLPAPVVSFVGTLGAFIRIRGPIPHRRALFDIGVAGPLAGFAVCLPVLVLGTLQARVIPDPGPDAAGFIYFGDPLLVQWAYAWLRSDPGPGKTFLMGPLAEAAWFGLFVTALNLMPVGQLDGGHVSYALLRRRATFVSRIAVVACFFLLYLRPTWLFWCLLLLVLGRPHPPTLDDDRPVGLARALVGAFALLVFAISFTPSPIIVSWSDFREGLSQLLTSR